MHLRLVFISLLAVCASSVADRGKKCSTPNSLEGRCIKLSDCPTVKDPFDQSSINLQDIQFLRLSQCGYEDNQPNVCCAISNRTSAFNRPTTVPRPEPAIPIFTRGGFGASLPDPGDCGVQSFDNKIFDGEVTSIDEFPWMALIEYNMKTTNNHAFACGGALINEKYVMTAAHCVTGEIFNRLGGLKGVRLGEHNLDKKIDCDYLFTDDCAPEPLDIKAAEIKIHPDYQASNTNQPHDIALIKLADEVPAYNDFVRPICLTKTLSINNTVPGKRHYVAGWGKTEYGVSSPVKLKIKVPIVAEEPCVKSYSRFGVNLISRQLCAGGERKRDSCSGDSGGPLMTPVHMPVVGQAWFASGVVSFGPNPCATRGVPGIYTRVSDYYDWIVKNLG